MNQLVDPLVCPICQAQNQCAEAIGNGQPCWCERAVFPPAVMAEIPATAIAKCCICQPCLKKLSLAQLV